MNFEILITLVHEHRNSTACVLIFGIWYTISAVGLQNEKWASNILPNV